MSRLDLTQKISQELMGLLPEFIREDAPLFEQFLKAYFEYLDSEIIIIDTQSEIDFVGLESGGALLFEGATTAPSPDKDTSKVVAESTPNNPFTFVSSLEVGEYIYGQTTGTLAELVVINQSILHVKTISGYGFLEGETVEGRTSRQTFVVKTYKENTIRANNNLLNYSDIDRTTTNLIEYWQKDFIPSLNFGDVQTNRLALKNIGQFYKQKGNIESIKYILRLIYGSDSEIFYPNEVTMYASTSDYSQRKRMSIEMVNSLRTPEPTDKITEYDNLDNIVAQSIIESVSFLGDGLYSIDINRVLSDNFTINSLVKLQDRDGITEYEAYVRGIMSGVQIGESSTYLSDEQDVDSIIVYEDDSGILLEKNSIGTNYRINDKINFTASRDDDGVRDATGFVSDLTSGPVEEIIIADPGSGFFSTSFIPIEFPVENSFTIAITGELDSVIQPGLRILGLDGPARKIVSVANDRQSFTLDSKVTLKVGDSIQIETPQYIVFDNNNTGGDGAVGLLGSVSDQIILENAPDIFGQYEFFSEAGQTIISGKDNYGRRLIFDNNTVEVWVDEILRQENDSTYGYTKQNDRIVFNNPLQAGQTIDIYHEYNYLTYEDNGYIGLENDFKVLTGTIDFTLSSDIIIGTNTIFTEELKVGDTLVDSNGLKYKIEQINNNTSATLVDDATVTQTETNVKRIRDAGAIRSIILQDAGYSYKTVPRVFPGGYIYFTNTSDIDIFQENEVITGQNSGAQCTVLNIEKNKRRLVVKKETNQSGSFLFGEAIQGNVGNQSVIPSGFNIAAGTGAELYAYGSNIGGVAEINITDQGGRFDSSGHLDESSTYNMVIRTPSSALNRDQVFTGRISGATGKVISYDSDRHILYYTELNGSFLFNEYVDYALVDEFQILKVDEFNARGKLSTRADVERQLTGDAGTISSTGSVLQDSLYYQTHSYVIRTAESINVYRSIIKDLVHPSGHIFFGEVSIQNQIRDSAIDTKFEPTIIINGDPVLGVPNAFENSIRIFEMFTRLVTLCTEDGDNVLMENGSRISVSTDDQINIINDPLTVLRDANEPKGPEGKRTGPDVDPRTGEPLAPYEIVDSIPIGATTEYYDSGYRNQHFNLKIISAFASAAQRNRLANRYTNVSPDTLEYISQKPYISLTGDVQEGDFPVLTHNGFSDPQRDFGGGLTALSLDMPNPVTEGEPTNSYPRNSSGSGKNRFGGVDGYFIPETRKLATQGKILSYSVRGEEGFIYEDGGYIEQELEYGYMRLEERRDAEVKGIFGDVILLEDESGSVLVETDTIEQPAGHLISERSYSNEGHYIYTEDGFTICTEDNERIINELGSQGSISSFVPLGTSVGSLNRIAGQRTYRISYYIQQENSDNIILEDGIGTILSESSESEGLTLNQLGQLFDWRISDFQSHSRQRTYVTYGSYVVSGA